MSGKNSIESVIEKHEASGKYFNVKGLQCFALDQGKGEAVLCLHGVPTSSFLYRNIVPVLADKGYRGVAIDFPGLGFSDRPEDFDYSFSSLAKFCAEAAKSLGLVKYHLLIHDIGGPIGFTLAAENRDKILSITVLNTWIDGVNFKKPWPMRPFEKPALGEIELATIQYPTWQIMFNKMGVNDSSAIPENEINAYVDILKRSDGGDAFLKIMRSFDNSEEFRSLCYKAVQNVPYPIQAVWGADDPFLTLDHHGQEIKEAAGLSNIHQLSSRHFLQEEKPMKIVAKLEEIIQESKQILPR
ncbi:haloalkane dehalogenase [Salegentibacter salinarum]|uniref:Haloalkane dehalogenase n=1 Tax=Salegentibacter salinarum TaxID=447422 RepID=A0A2N0TY43_9FLAO|nr:alpha/beta hydrolase [Salegentibacter salinarum]PKD19664.1 haloalkane dehalogenase [Salegentibacter salinarum]SKB90882.1 Pimeloyl-ACP methyl ester carboxylesterase [Salegentibacter salinarum]